MPGRHDGQQGDDRRTIEEQPASPLEQRQVSPGALSSSALDSSALEQIVNETAARLLPAAETDPALKAAMTEVARQYPGQPITVDPVGTALLEAVLRAQFPVLAARPALLTHTARSVATTLLADPTARLRVEHLWATLGEEEP